MQHTPFPYPEIKKSNYLWLFCREGSARQWTSGLPLGSLRGPRRWSEWQRWAAHLSAAPGGAGGGGWPLQPLLGKRRMFLIVINGEKSVIFVLKITLWRQFLLWALYGVGAECYEGSEPNLFMRIWSWALWGSGAEFLWGSGADICEDPEPRY